MVPTLAGEARPLDVVLFGGSFDPFHNGHLQLIKAIDQQRLCRTLVVMTAGTISAHGKHTIATAAQRLAMAQLALEDEAFETKVIVDPWEATRATASYTFHTLEYLRGRYGADQRYGLVVGQDWAGKIDRWYRGPEVLAMAQPVVFNRPGYPQSPELSSSYLRVTMDPVDISASDIRSAMARGDNMSYALPPRVYRYAFDHRIYSA